MSFSNGSNTNTNTNAKPNTNVSIPQLIRVTQSNSVNTNERNAATSQLKYLEESHFANYMMELVRILGSNNNNDENYTAVRQGAGLLLKNCVKNSAFNRTRWMKLAISARNKLKQGILSVLGLSVVEARSTAVNVISNLALMEGLSEWRDLVPYLISKCLSKKRELMYSSLKCIGQLAEMIEDSSLLTQYCGKMLECIAHGMSCHGACDVQSESMKCLYQIIELIAANMAVEKERRIIFQMVCCGGRIDNVEVRLYSFMCISRLIDHYYPLCEPFMQSIFQISKTCIASGIAGDEDENVTKQAIEIWSTTADIESIESSETKNFGFINKSLQLLVPIYLSALLKQKEEFDADEWTIRKAAACSLELFASVAKDNILPYVLTFVERNIGLSNWHNREAALCSFGCVLDGPSTNKLSDLVSQILPAILKLMRDEHEQVRISAVWTFGRICELIPSACDSQGSDDILAAVVSALNDKQHISNKACWCIASLTKNRHESIASSAQTGYKLICELLTRGRRSDTDCTLIIGIHEAINGVIYCLKTEENGAREMLQSLLPELVEQMKQVLSTIGQCATNQNNNNSISSQLEYNEYKLAGLLSSIQVILDKLGGGCLSSDLSNDIMGCVVAATSTNSKTNNENASDLVYEEALGLITHIARCIGNNFHIYLSSTPIQQVLIESIRSGTDDSGNGSIEICRIGVGVAGDVYTQCTPFICAHPMKLREYSDRIVSELLTILINNSIGMELKSHIVDALTDILIAHGQYAYRYSADILDKCLTIGCLTPPQSAHKEDNICAIFNEIRVSIVDTTRSCLAELANANKIEDFAKYIAKINQFFGATANDLARCHVNVLKRCCKLLSEAADYCHGNNELKQQLRTHEIQKILQHTNEISKSIKDDELAKEALNAFQQLQ